MASLLGPIVRVHMLGNPQPIHSPQEGWQARNLSVVVPSVIRMEAGTAPQQQHDHGSLPAHPAPDRGQSERAPGGDVPRGPGVTEMSQAVAVQAVPFSCPPGRRGTSRRMRPQRNCSVKCGNSGGRRWARTGDPCLVRERR